MVWADSSKYIGDWQFDNRAYGEMFLVDESVYKGLFYKDLFHGKAQITMTDKTVF